MDCGGDWDHTDPAPANGVTNGLVMPAYRLTALSLEPIEDRLLPSPFGPHVPPAGPAAWASLPETGDRAGAIPGHPPGPAALPGAGPGAGFAFGPGDARSPAQGGWPRPGDAWGVFVGTGSPVKNPSGAASPAGLANGVVHPAVVRVAPDPSAVSPSSAVSPAGPVGTPGEVVRPAVPTHPPAPTHPAAEATEAPVAAPVAVVPGHVPESAATAVAGAPGGVPQPVIGPPGPAAPVADRAALAVIGGAPVTGTPPAGPGSDDAPPAAETGPGAGAPAPAGDDGAIVADDPGGTPAVGWLPFDLAGFEQGVRELWARLADSGGDDPEAAAGTEDYLWLTAAVLLTGGAAAGARAGRPRRPSDRVVIGSDSVLARWGERHGG